MFSAQGPNGHKDQFLKKRTTYMISSKPVKLIRNINMWKLTNRTVDRSRIMEVLCAGRIPNKENVKTLGKMQVSDTSV